MNKCDDCDREITLTLEAYGNGQLMRIDCPKCGVSYDTNLDPVEGEGECDKCEDTYELSDRTARCGDCGNCNNCCTHEGEKVSNADSRD